MSRLLSVLRPLALYGTLTLMAACGGGDGSSAATSSNAGSARPLATPTTSPTSTAAPSIPSPTEAPVSSEPVAVPVSSEPVPVVNEPAPSNDPLPPVDETPPEGPATGTAQLSWLAPTTNADGTALVGLAGYRIRYGADPEALDKTIEIDNPSVLAYTVENLTPGAWYFEVVAVNDADIEGPPSNLGSKTL